jgi:hypothetical protein
VQQAKRLMGAGIHRHFGLQRVITDFGIDNAQMRHQVFWLVAFSSFKR